MARPRFVPNAETRKMVRSMAAYGIRQEEIACCLGLRSPKTLRRHFREELNRAAPEVPRGTWMAQSSGPTRRSAGVYIWLTLTHS